MASIIMCLHKRAPSQTQHPFILQEDLISEITEIKALMLCLGK